MGITSKSKLGATWLILFFCGDLVGEEPKVLTGVPEVRRLTPDQAAKGLPVRLTGVLTWHPEDAFYAFILDDGKEGIFCDVQMAMRRGLLPERFDADVLAKTVNEGVRIEVEGLTEKGAYAPMIVPKAMRVIGPGEMPAPKAEGFLNLFSGQLDCQRVVAEGVVRAAYREQGAKALTLDVGTFFGSFQFRVMEPGHLNWEALVDARVRVTGCVLPIYNGREEMIGVTVQSNRPQDIVILKKAPADPFAVPEITTKSLRPFTADKVELHRQKVTGVVTVVRPGAYLFIQHGDQGVKAFTRSEQRFEVGDLVEAVGFVNFRTAVGCLENAQFRKIGKGVVAAPQAVTVERLLASGGDAVRDPTKEDWDGRMVSLEGRIASLEKTKDQIKLTIESDGRFVPLTLVPEEPEEGISEWVIGARVRATAVADISYKASIPMGNELKPNALHLLLRSVADVVVLQPAPWWSEDRVALAQFLVPVLFLGAGLWIVALRRMVAKQGSKLEEALVAYRNVDQEREACQKERMRLAGDLHDGFQQVLAGAMYRLDAAMTCAKEMPENLKKQLGGAEAALKQAQKGLRDALWGLTRASDGPARMSELIRHAAGQMDHWKDKVTVESVGEERPVPIPVMGHLLMLFQEAVGNAITHGKANEVDVEVRYYDRGVALVIADDGTGFDPKAAEARANGSHFGLRGMKRRMRELDGTLTIESEPGSGARVTAYVPLKKVMETTPQESPERGMEAAVLEV